MLLHVEERDTNVRFTGVASYRREGRTKRLKIEALSLQTSGEYILSNNEPYTP